jgi:hypothetical protein
MMRVRIIRSDTSAETRYRPYTRTNSVAQTRLQRTKVAVQPEISAAVTFPLLKITHKTVLDITCAVPLKQRSANHVDQLQDDIPDLTAHADEDRQ